MVLTLSNMGPLHQKAPDFNLLDVITNEKMTLKEIQSDIATVIMFICNHCPYVKHILDVLLALTYDYLPKGISFVAINSNDVEAYPEDSPEEMRKLAEQKNFSFPYLFDSTQQVAKAYGAACTPDFFVYGKNMKSVYRGQFDDSRPGNHNTVTGKDLSEVLDCLVTGEKIKIEQHPSMGCNIKWKNNAFTVTG